MHPSKLLRILLVICTTAAGLVLAGCATKSPEESTIPWSRPANWEGTMPGMPTSGGAY